ncbi:hypothetical protein Fmac_001187 [Flemingia macrophylla]|uniref:Beta-galactosidase beta-sandwich domain-containing protein n=1 Tax=Flemingia macrophylla TaxID=520843 RepID=A0ABD1NGD0_9FABA
MPSRIWAINRVIILAEGYFGRLGSTLGNQNPYHIKKSIKDVPAKIRCQHNLPLRTIWLIHIATVICRSYCFKKLRYLDTEKMSQDCATATFLVPSSASARRSRRSTSSSASAGVPRNARRPTPSPRRSTSPSSSSTCVALISNVDDKNDKTVQFRNASYHLPAWSVSILPDCMNVVFNTEKMRNCVLDFSLLFSLARLPRFVPACIHHSVTSQKNIVAMIPESLQQSDKGVNSFKWGIVKRSQVSGEARLCQKWNIEAISLMPYHHHFLQAQAYAWQFEQEKAFREHLGVEEKEVLAAHDWLDRGKKTNSCVSQSERPLAQLQQRRLLPPAPTPPEAFPNQIRCRDGSNRPWGRNAGQIRDRVTHTCACFAITHTADEASAAFPAVAPMTPPRQASCRTCVSRRRGIDPFPLSQPDLHPRLVVLHDTAAAATPPPRSSPSPFRCRAPFSLHAVVGHPHRNQVKFSSAMVPFM